MENMVLENLTYVSEDDKKRIGQMLSANIDLGSFIQNEYNKLFANWKFANFFDVPSGVIAISINGNTQLIKVGPKKYSDDTIFDIASMTKLYTEIILLEFLKDNPNISLDTKVSDLIQNYSLDSTQYGEIDLSVLDKEKREDLEKQLKKQKISQVKDLTLFDLISFNNDYRTVIDVRKCESKEQAIKALRTSYIVEEEEENGEWKIKKGVYKYTDLPIMILTDILEQVSKMEYKDLFQKYIIGKFGLKDTHLVLDDDDKERYISINGKYVNDPKANRMGGYYGHAGVKVTPEDFIKFLNVVLKNYNQTGLFTTPSDTVISNGNRAIHKAKIGNCSLSVPKGTSLPGCTVLSSDNLPKKGFIVQGSVRCQGETCIFNINGKEYVVSVSVMLDCYTQDENMASYIPIRIDQLNKEIANLQLQPNVDIDKIKKCEKAIKDVKGYLLKYNIKDVNGLAMVDMRGILPYSTFYKPLLNMIGESRALALYQYLSLEENIQPNR